LLKGSNYYEYKFNTFTFRSFNWISKIFYKKGKKYVNKEIEKYFTSLSLAIWIMNSGSWAQPGVRLTTSNFSYEEVEFLVKILTKNFYLHCTIQYLNDRKKYFIYIKGSSIPQLRGLVLPFMHKSMYYKLGL
jgi:predicted thioredoxin/glutaredoxin